MTQEQYGAGGRRDENEDRDDFGPTARDDEATGYAADAAQVHPGWTQQSQASYDAASSGGWGGPHAPETGPLELNAQPDIDRGAKGGLLAGAGGDPLGEHADRSAPRTEVFPVARPDDTGYGDSYGDGRSADPAGDRFLGETYRPDGAGSATDGDAVTGPQADPAPVGTGSTGATAVDPTTLGARPTETGPTGPGPDGAESPSWYSAGPTAAPDPAYGAPYGAPPYGDPAGGPYGPAYGGYGPAQGFSAPGGPGAPGAPTAGGDGPWPAPGPRPLAPGGWQQPGAPKTGLAAVFDFSFVASATRTLARPLFWLVVALVVIDLITVLVSNLSGRGTAPSGGTVFFLFLQTLATGALKIALARLFLELCVNVADLAQSRTGRR